MTFVQTIPIEEATSELRAIYDEDLQAYGRVLVSTEMLSLRPAALDAYRGFGGSLRASLAATMDPRRQELIKFAAALRLQCST